MDKNRNGGHARLWGATLVIGVTLWLSFRPQHPSSESDRLVTPEVLAQALSSDVPDRLALSDDLDFFSRRLDERGPDDVLALRRIVSASLLRFQTYGRGAELPGTCGEASGDPRGSVPDLVESVGNRGLGEVVPP